MSAFRELLDALRGQVRTTQLHPPNRPTSLFEAGSAGTGGGQPMRTRQTRETAQDEPIPHRDLYPETPEGAIERPRRKRPDAVAARPRTDARAALRVALRSPASLRTAILLREVLDAPVSLREDHHR